MDSRDVGVGGGGVGEDGVSTVYSSGRTTSPHSPESSYPVRDTVLPRPDQGPV